MKEVWKEVIGYETLYAVSNLGRIKAFAKHIDSGKCHRSWDEHILKCASDQRGYLKTNLAKDGVNRTVKVHRIVAQAFIPNPDNLPEVNHKDGNKQNNSVENLEWSDRLSNQRHAVKSGLWKPHYGESNGSSKLTKDDVEFIRNNYIPRNSDYGANALAKQFGVHRKTIGRIASYKNWKEGDADESLSTSSRCFRKDTKSQ